MIFNAMLIICNVSFYRFPLEMHVVHVNKNMTDPIHTRKGLAVVGFFFKLSVWKWHALNKKNRPTLFRQQTTQH